MSKGSANAAKNQVGTNNAYATGYRQQGQQSLNTLFPFLTGEVTNPQGYGQDAVNDMLTQGGEAVSGATGAANEKASLLASRTGNTAALPGIIGANARGAMKQDSDNALDVAIKNADLKQKQQQAGASGLGSLYGQDTNAVLKSLGLANESIDEWTKGRSAAQAATLDWTKEIAQLAGKGLTAAAGGPGGGGGGGGGG